MRPFPADERALEEEIERQTADVARSWAWLALEEAVIVWERHAPNLKMTYRDSVVGLHHEIDPALPRRTLAATEDHAALEQEWLEPITALQDDDWDLPAPARDAFYAAYNAHARRYGTCVGFARVATFYEYDRARFDELWSRWWSRVAPVDSTQGRLPIQLPGARFVELAAATYAALGIPFRIDEPSVRSVPPARGVESITVSTWRDGDNVVEFERTLDEAVAMESRDRSFEARMSIPAHRAEIAVAGMDDFGSYRLVADADSLPVVRAALMGAAARMAARAGQWTNRYAAPREWVEQARGAVIDSVRCDMRTEPWIVLPNRFAIEVRAYHDPGTACARDAFELETIGPLPEGEVIELGEVESDPLDARKIFAAIARRSLTVAPEEIVVQGNAKAERYRAHGFVLRRWSQVIDGRVKSERIFLQNGVGVFLRRENRTRGVSIGADCARLLQALGLGTRRTATDAEVDGRGIPHVHVAAEIPRMAELVELLEAGADPDVFDRDGRSALRVAASRGHGEAVAKLLEHGALVDARDPQGRTPLMFARGSAVDALLDAGAFVDARDKQGRSALHHAAASGFDDEVSKLLDAGSFIDGRDLSGNAPLHLAAQGSHGHVDYTGDDMERAGRSQSGHDAVVGLLLRRGGDPNATNDAGRTPLSCAEAVGNTWIAERLRKTTS